MLHCVERIFLQQSQSFVIVGKESLLAEFLVERFAVEFVVVFEDGCTKILHLFDDIPRLVVAYLLVHIVHHPS